MRVPSSALGRPAAGPEALDDRLEQRPVLDRPGVPLDDQVDSPRRAAMQHVDRRARSLALAVAGMPLLKYRSPPCQRAPTPARWGRPSGRVVDRNQVVIGSADRSASRARVQGSGSLAVPVTRFGGLGCSARSWRPPWSPSRLRPAREGYGGSTQGTGHSGLRPSIRPAPRPALMATCRCRCSSTWPEVLEVSV